MSPILGSSPGGVLCSSPPAKSSFVPIKAARPLSKSVPCQDVAEGRLSFSRRVSETGNKLSFGCKRTISISSTPSASGSKPPVAPSAPRAVHVGFAAPESSGVCLSPGRRETKSSLMSRALLDTPSVANNELFGCAAPVQSFQGLVVVPGKVAEVDMQPLFELQAQHPVFHSSSVTAAYAVAARAHAGQVRKSGDTVLSHCTATALILAELGLPEEVVSAGLLHDVLCDTSMQAWQLSQALPDSIVSLVSKVHHLNRLSQTYRDNTHSLEAETMLDMLTGMDDVTALLIKLADRLHNMRTIGSLARCKQVRMASETLDVFAVLANRLGAWSIKAELEDLCFKTLNPEEYQLISDAIAARAAAEHSSAALAAGVDEITTALLAVGLDVVDVSGRVKNVYGVWKKVQKNLHKLGRGLSINSSSSSDDDQEPSSPVSPATAAAAPSGSSPSDRAKALEAALAQVYDIQALRVVVPHKHDCYAAMRVVEQLWTPMPGRMKDYIRNRKANGYQSLHLTVRDGQGQPMEVQIRTPKMHYIAEYGFAAHWKYKEKLGRQDLWLDRLVQWKRWIASVKLGIHDRKVRPSGSPGSGGDAAVAGLAAKLGLEAAVSGGVNSDGLAAALGVGAPIRTISAGDAVAAELEAMEEQEQAEAAMSAAAAASSSNISSSPADAKFAARFRMQPISKAEMDAHGASVMISGPRGVSIAQLPARCTVGQLLGSREVTDQMSRTSSGGLSSALSQMQFGLGLPTAASSCRLAVNGVVVMPSMADHVVLKSGDQVQLLEDPMVPVALPHAGNDIGGVQMVDQNAVPAGLPGVMAEAGESLHLFVPGQLEPLEVALKQKLSVAPRAPVRSPALVL